MRILRIDHVGVAVGDLDAAIAFYAETFGLVAVHEETNEEQGVREAMLAPAGSGQGSGHGSGHGSGQASAHDPGATRLQLLAPLRPDSPIGRFLDRSGPGLQQLAYTVEDVDAAAAELRGKGLRVLYETARRGTAGSRVNFVHPRDAGGVLVELVEPAEPSGNG